MGELQYKVRTVGDGGITTNAVYYAAVSNGSNFRLVSFPHLAMSATNMPSAPQTEKEKGFAYREAFFLCRSPHVSKGTLVTHGALTSCGLLPD
ncbi:MAG: hypothetical protein WBB81_03305, partial [Pyrinomonadaceae bacterium]